MRLITSINKDYLPGLIALNNSIKANSPDTPLTCIVFGDDKLVKSIEDEGIEVLANPEIKADLPVSKLWPKAEPAMYARLFIPEWFDEPCAWVDADCLVLKKIQEVKFDQPVAAVMTSTTMLIQQIPNIKKDGHKPALFSGFLIYNLEKWNALQITEKCLEAMKEPLDYLYAVQSVLSYVLKGNFHRLHDNWQVFANRSTTTEEVLKRAIMLHYVGVLPWKDTCRNREAFEKYAGTGNRRKGLHRKPCSKKTAGKKSRPANIRQAKDGG